MHPSKKEATSSHSSKLKRMTRDYGSASGDANNILAPMDRLKKEGGEQPVGFGADSAMSSARSDRPARRSVAANPLATYKKGGAVRERAFGGRLDGKPPMRSAKGATNVNVIIAPQGGAQPNPGMVPPPGGPPVPPPSAPLPPPAPPMGAGPMAPPPPGGMPPGLIAPRAKGGRINKEIGDAGVGPHPNYDAGSLSGEGRLEKIAAYGKKTSHAKPQTV